MTNLMQQHFDQPQQCPYCGKQPPEGQAIEIDHRTAQQPVRCPYCGRWWWDLYQLSAVIDDTNTRHTAEAPHDSDSAGREDRDRR
jgi:DNA-directed RNA polymerase subunit RPC12/RpoP